MNFKDYIKKDNDTFFDLDEFGEVHSLNGREITIIIDNEKLEKYKTKYSDSFFDISSLDKLELMIICRKEDIGEEKFKNGTLNLDGKAFKIYRRINETDTISFILGAN